MWLSADRRSDGRARSSTTGVQDNQTRYDVVDVNANVVATLLAQPAESFRRRFGKYGKPPAPEDRDRRHGFRLDLGSRRRRPFGTSPTDHVSAGSRSVTIPEQVVARDGAISVPFAGRVPVAGRSTVEVQHEIERRLAEKAIEPQVIVTVAKSVTNAATVSGEVVNGARVPLSVDGDRLLDLIALAGGAKSPVYDTFVRLSRNGVTATIPMERLVRTRPRTSTRSPGTF